MGPSHACSLSPPTKEVRAGTSDHENLAHKQPMTRKAHPPHKNLPLQTPCMHVARFPRTRIHVGKHGSSNPAIRALCPSAAPKDARTPRVQRHPTLRPNLPGRSARMILPARFEEGGPKDSVPRLLRNALGVTKRLCERRRWGPKARIWRGSWGT